MAGPGTVVSETESLCPVCLRGLPASRVAEGDTVWLVKVCPEHGTFRTKIWEGLPAFGDWVRPKTPATMRHPATEVSLGCPFDCGLCVSHRQETCTAVVEVTNRCNLHCTFCFADAGGESTDPELSQIRGWYQTLLDTSGPCNLQISGGEPTLRNDLPEIVAMARDMGFTFIQLNTNGLRISADRKFLQDLKQAGLSSVFLQFDGTKPDIYRKLRKVDLLRQKLEAVRRCGELGIGVVLVPTVVPGVNDENLGDIIEFALEQLPYVRGVHFQPASFFGRIPYQPSDESRLTIPEIIHRIEQQTSGRMKSENFRPPGCESAMCSFHGNFILMADGGLLPTTRHEVSMTCCGPVERAEEGARKAKRFVANHWSVVPTSAVAHRHEDPVCCTPSDSVTVNSTKSGLNFDSLDTFLQRAQTHTLSISGMAFQDAWNLDLERLKECCIHSVAPDGRLIPFCAYNLTDESGRYLYRGRTQVETEVMILNHSSFGDGGANQCKLQH